MQCAYGPNPGAVPSAATAAHPAPSISIPSTIGGSISSCDFHSLRNLLTSSLVTAWNSSELSAHGTRYPDDQWAAQPFLQHAVSDVYAQVPAIPPFLNPYGDPQASSSAAMQSQPHLNLNNMFVPDAR